MLLLVFLIVNLGNTRDAVVKRAVQSYSKLCTFLSLLLRINRGYDVPCVQLATACVDYLMAHKRSWGVRWWLPKMHYLLHIPFMMLANGILISCFVHERKHKEIKRYIATRLNTRNTFEKTILADILYYQKMMLAETSLQGTVSAHLVNPKPAPPKLGQWVQATLMTPSAVSTAKMAQCSHLQCHVNDVVVASTTNGKMVGQVEFHVEVDGMCLTCVQPWLKLPVEYTYQVCVDERVMILTSSIESLCIFKVKDGIAIAVNSIGVDV
jgi:hypothetical protein